MFEKKSLAKFLKGKAKEFEVYIYDSVTSTNDLAKEFAQSYPNNEAVIIASTQTAGRGRRGRTFFSPHKTGLYMSIVLRPEFSPQTTSLLTPCAALCVAKAIERVSNKNTQIKWINDIYIDGKKVSGILCESAFSSNTNLLDYVVVGIGINLSNPDGDFPNDIKDIATTVFGNVRPSNSTIEKLCSLIINDICENSLNLESKNFIEEYKSRLFMLNSEVDVITANETYSAIAIDIDENAHLIVSLPDGSQRTLDAGEISIRQKKEC